MGSHVFSSQSIAILLSTIVLNDYKFITFLVILQIHVTK